MKTLVFIFLFATQLRMHAKTFAENPVANAEVNYSFMSTAPGGLLVTLNGSKSKDPDGHITRYIWTQTGAGPNIAQITQATAAVTTVAPSSWAVGVYTFQLEVTDNKGATGIAIVKVTVVNSGSAQLAFKP